MGEAFSDIQIEFWPHDDLPLSTQDQASALRRFQDNASLAFWAILLPRVPLSQLPRALCHADNGDGRFMPFTNLVGKANAQTQEHQEKQAGTVTRLSTLITMLAEESREQPLP